MTKVMVYIMSCVMSPAVSCAISSTPVPDRLSAQWRGLTLSLP